MMDLREELRRPPAIIGLVLLALVVTTALFMQLGLDGDDGNGETEVAGQVFERSEPPVTEEPQVVREPAILRPRSEDVVEPQDDGGDVVAQPDPVVVVQPPPAGLVRDPGDEPGVADPTDPAPDPKPKPKPDPDPTPTPSPTPPDTSRFELHSGEGHSRDTAIADSGDWLFLVVDGHGGQSATSRSAQARLTVGFTESAKQGSGPERDLSCHAVLTAGSRRLITDRDHVFELSLWTADENGVPQEKTDAFVLLRRAFDLGAGESRTLSMDPVERDANDEINYACRVTYTAL